METWSIHQLVQSTENKLNKDSAQSLRLYALNLKNKKLPVIFTLRHLSHITGVPYLILLNTIKRRREVPNYKMYAISKRAGGKRYIHSVHKHLFAIQQFINQEILQRTVPHHAAEAFHSSGGIRQCAAKHCNARWLFQFDLENFFYSINEFDVYNVFKRLGYKPLLAFELARLCTTTRLPKHLLSLLIPCNYENIDSYAFYRTPHSHIGVLPQGAPSSPMLSNLASESMDEQLSSFAEEFDFIYTRYADDITLSSSIDPRKRISVAKINYIVTKIVRVNGFKINKKKTRVAGPGSRKIVLGLLVDGECPRLSKQTYKRIDRLLYASKKYGLQAVAEKDGFDSALGLYNHIEGLLGYVKAVDEKRWKIFNSKFSSILIPAI